MTKKENYEQKAQELILPLLEKNHFELVDLEYVKEAGTYYLRAYIDKEGGITINDCELISRAFSDLLDKNDFIEDSYIMEVSSPVLGRVLKKDRDYTRNLGKDVEIRLFAPVNGTKELTGQLVSFDPESVTIAISADKTITFRRKELALIREAVDF